MDDLHALKQAAAEAWDAYQVAAEAWENSAPGPAKIDAGVAMMNAGTAYNAAWDAYERAVKESNRKPQKEAE